LFTEFWKEFAYDINHTTWYEYLAVITGIASVWFSRIESIWTYPVGLINTIIYIYISVAGDLYGEASVNLYYTIMSIYGWILWAKRNQQHEHIVHIKYSDKRWFLYQAIFVLGFYIVLFFSLTYLKSFAKNAIPWADAFASATAYTGMWLMTKKKVESWWWWIATNIASIPLYAVKHYALTSVYYFILLVFAFWGLAEWRKRTAIGKTALV
jgi:nicotinamide mononucleotide transporter